MQALVFQDQAPIVASDPNRVDIACFVGFVPQRAGAIPDAVRRWLSEQGWLDGPYGRASAAALLDVPVPVDTWDAFDWLFAWDRRALDGRGQIGTSYLGAAVRSFFAQGGRKCYVVRVGDPWPLLTPQAERVRRLGDLIPGFPGSTTAAPADRQSWHGIGHLFGLPDVSFLCLPDLPDAVASDAPAPAAAVRPAPIAERFVECSAVVPPAPVEKVARLFRAPRCDAASYARWWQPALEQVVSVLVQQRREVQLVASVPIPETGCRPEADLAAFLSAEVLDHGPNGYGPGVASSFLQLAYPWARTPIAGSLPEGLESPDGVLTGVLARNALTRGAFRSAAGLHLADVYDVQPLLSDRELPGSGAALADRVSVLGPTPGGLQLLSDVTSSASQTYRPAGVHRLVSVIVRAARRLGEDMVFEASSEALWARLRERLTNLLAALLRAGALRGTTPAQAFQVRCDQSTMTQNDQDNGRVVAYVQFDAAAPIERITVVLAMDEGGQVTLVSAQPALAEAA